MTVCFYFRVKRMTTVNHNSDFIKYNGRTVVFENIDARFFNWSGSGFEFCFSGTSAFAEFLIGDENESVPNENDRAYIGVFVDDSPYMTARFPLDKNSGTYALAEGLPCGVHTVKVVKETEMWYGRAGLGSLSCDGEFLALPEKNTKTIEFIGDSIVCGYGNLCSNASPDFVTREESFSNTFAAMSAKTLGCSLSVVAASGNGFFHDYGCSTVNLIPELYEYGEKVFSSHLGLVPQKWDFENDKCAAVVIKLGNNDWQYCSLADVPEEQRSEELKAQRRKEFEEAAYKFFKRVGELRPQTPILFICEDDTALKEECFSAARRAGCVETLSFPSKREYEGVGANGHYSVYTHARVARLVADKLREMI